MSNITTLDEHRPMTPLYEITVYRKTDGTLMAGLTWASTDWVKANGNSVSERLDLIALDLPELSKDMAWQADEARQDGE